MAPGSRTGPALRARVCAALPFADRAGRAGRLHNRHPARHIFRRCSGRTSRPARNPKLGRNALRLGDLGRGPHATYPRADARRRICVYAWEAAEAIVSAIIVCGDLVRALKREAACILPRRADVFLVMQAARTAPRRSYPTLTWSSLGFTVGGFVRTIVHPQVHWNNCARTLRSGAGENAALSSASETSDTAPPPLHLGCPREPCATSSAATRRLICGSGQVWPNRSISAKTRFLPNSPCDRW